MDLKVLIGKLSSDITGVQISGIMKREVGSCAIYPLRNVLQSPGVPHQCPQISGDVEAPAFQKKSDKLFREPLLLWLLPCERSDTQQKWYFTHYQASNSSS